MWIWNGTPEKGWQSWLWTRSQAPIQNGRLHSAQIDSFLKSKVSGIESALRKNIAALGNNYNNLSEKQKMLLVDYSYNTEDSFAKFPKMSKAIVDGDFNTMNI